jgi:hypothetical protein
MASHLKIDLWCLDYFKLKKNLSSESCLTKQEYKGSNYEFENQVNYRSPYATALPIIPTYKT